MMDKTDVIRPGAVLVIDAGSRIFYASLEDNPSSEAFKERLSPEVLSLDMRDDCGFGKTADLPWELPHGDGKTAAGPGDIMLCQENRITICFCGNTRNSTRLARIGEETAEELREILGEGNLKIRFSLEWGE